MEALRDGVPFGIVGLGCLRTHDSSSDVTRAKVDIRQDAEGDFQAMLAGHFTLRVAGNCAFRVRLLYLFLRLLEVPGATRKSRRTRDGRTPFVRQQHLSQVFGICQPELSRIEGYWLDGDWPVESANAFGAEQGGIELHRRSLCDLSMVALATGVSLPAKARIRCQLEPGASSGSAERVVAAATVPGAPLPNHREELPTAGQLVGIRAAVASPMPAREVGGGRRDDTGGACLDCRFADAGF